MELLSKTPIDLSANQALAEYKLYLETHPHSGPDTDPNSTRRELENKLTAVSIREIKVDQGLNPAPLNRFAYNHPKGVVLVFAPSSTAETELEAMYKREIALRKLIVSKSKPK